MSLPLPVKPLAQGMPDRTSSLDDRATVASGLSGGTRILRNSTFNLLAQALYALIYLAAIFVLARSLGKEGLGQFYTLFALLLVVQIIAEAGVGTMLTCRISQAPAAWRGTAAQAGGLFAAIALASGLFFLAIGGAVAWLRSDVSALLPYLAAGVACAGLQVQRYCSGIFRAFELFGCENLAKLVQGVVFTGFIVVLAARGQATLPTVMAGLAASHVAAGGYMLLSLHLRWRCLGWQCSAKLAREWLAGAVPLGFGDLVRGLTWQLDTVLLGWLQPAAVVGIYSVAYRPLGPLNWLPRSVATAAFPAFARLAETDRGALGRTFSHCVRLLWLASLPIAVAICVCAEVVVTTLAGPDYLESAQPLRILIWIACLSFLSFPLGLLFAALSQQRLYARLVLGVFLLELILELALIPIWGYYGACTGSIVGELTFTVAGLALCRRLGAGGIEWKPLLGAAAAAAIMAAILWPVRHAGLAAILPATLLAGCLYVLVCLMVGALRWTEVQRFFQALFSIRLPLTHEQTTDPALH
jgi:O-antigen/teichoic acid export membrane protein